MALMLDTRLPLLFGRAEDAGPDDALLIEGEGSPEHGRDWFMPAAPTGHPANCACCLPRNSAGIALSRLLLARARGQGLYFRRVIAVTSSAEGENAVRQALGGDPLASACFVLRQAGGDVPSPPDPPSSVDLA